ncbi:MAG: squalene--hopene cyclase [Acidobacteriota bacterium]
MEIINGEESNILHGHMRTHPRVTTTGTGGLSFPHASGLIENAFEAIKKIQSHYLDRQEKEGFWWYELEANATITAEYMMLLHFLGIKDEARDRKMARHILRNQRTDGTWAIHWGGDGDLSTTIEAYFALKLAGYSAEEEPLRRARAFVIDKGGVEEARVFTKIFLAVFGEFDWKAIPSIPVEINLLPVWFPVNIYNLSSWARSTIVPLSVVLEMKPVRTVPEFSGVRELYATQDKKPLMTTKRLPIFSWKKFFIALDGMLKKTENSSLRIFRNKAMDHTERWIREHQDPTGDWGGIQPAMVNSILALAARGHDVSDDAIRKGLEALERFTIERGDELLLQSCISPVWDTALTALALLQSGMEEEHPSIIEACKWLASRQISTKGDWSVKRPELEPGGWAFEFDNSWYPDVDDSAVVLMLLSRYAKSGFVSSPDIERGVRWVLGMQGRDGGWGAFDVDNNMKMLNQLPFGDLEAMIDPSTPDITGRVLELLGMLGYDMENETVRRAIEFLRETQEEDGTWWGRWGVNYIYGTSIVLSGLRSVGEDMGSVYVRKAVDWIKKSQRPDGGWGECCESYNDPALKCSGASTPSQTAWALLALMAAGEETSENTVKGIRYLLKRQGPDGTWDEEWFTGTGFPKYFMLRYHNYRNCFPLMALGKFASRFRGQRSGK